MPRKINDPLDSTPFTIGLITILKQYHSEYTEDFIALIGQYARSTTEASAAKYALAYNFAYFIACYDYALTIPACFVTYCDYALIMPLCFIACCNYALIMTAYFVTCCNYALIMPAYFAMCCNVVLIVLAYFITCRYYVLTKHICYFIHF